MAWPTEAGSLGIITAPRRSRSARRRPFHVRPLITPVQPASARIITTPRRRRHVPLWRPACFVKGAAGRGERRFVFSGNYCVENAPQYRAYWGLIPPKLGDPVKATFTDFPFNPADIIGDGHWYYSLTYFDGYIESGFLPVGPKGQTYLELVISSGETQINPPQVPAYWHLETREGGTVRVIGVYDERGETRAEEWSIAYTTDGSVPDMDSPTVDPGPSMDTTGKEDLSYDLPTTGLAHGTAVNVRLQVRRDDSGTWSYSATEELTLGQAGYLTINTDKEGPTVPVGAERWPGRTPEEL